MFVLSRNTSLILPSEVVDIQLTDPLEEVRVAKPTVSLLPLFGFDHVVEPPIITFPEVSISTPLKSMDVPREKYIGYLILLQSASCVLVSLDRLE